MSKFKLVWRGKEVAEAVLTKTVSPALAEAGLRVESKSKQKLRASKQERNAKGKAVFVKGGGHGVRTATLRRSIHTAAPGYSWASDDVEPASGTPERGGTKHDPGKVGDRLTVQVGTGMRYAIYVHQKHNDPTVLHFLITSGAEVRKEMPTIIGRYRLR